MRIMGNIKKVKYKYELPSNFELDRYGLHVRLVGEWIKELMS